jgi:hypothetical protein
MEPSPVVEKIWQVVKSGTRREIYDLLMKVPPLEKIESYPIRYLRNAGNRNLGIGCLRDNPKVFVKTYQEKLYTEARGPSGYLDVACQSINYVLAQRLLKVAPHFLRVYHRYRDLEKVYILMERADSNVADYLTRLVKLLLPENMMSVWEYYQTPQTKIVGEQYQTLQLLEDRIAKLSHDAREKAVARKVNEAKTLLKTVRQHTEAYQIAERKLFDLQDARALLQGPVPFIEDSALEALRNDMGRRIADICLSIRLQILIIDYLFYRYYHTAYADRHISNYVIELVEINQGAANKKIEIQGHDLIAENIHYLQYVFADGQVLNIRIRHPITADLEHLFIVKVADLDALRGGTFAVTPELQKISDSTPAVRYLSDRPRQLSYKAILKHCMLPNDNYFHENGPLLKVPVDDVPLILDPEIPKIRPPLPNNRFETIIAQFSQKVDNDKILQLNIP